MFWGCCSRNRPHCLRKGTVHYIVKMVQSYCAQEEKLARLLLGELHTTDRPIALSRITCPHLKKFCYLITAYGKYVTAVQL